MPYGGRKITPSLGNATVRGVGRWKWPGAGGDIKESEHARVRLTGLPLMYHLSLAAGNDFPDVQLRLMTSPTW